MHFKQNPTQLSFHNQFQTSNRLFFFSIQNYSKKLKTQLDLTLEKAFVFMLLTASCMKPTNYKIMDIFNKYLVFTFRHTKCCLSNLRSYENLVQGSANWTTKAVAESLDTSSVIYNCGNAGEVMGLFIEYLAFTLQLIKWRLYARKTFKSLNP